MTDLARRSDEYSGQSGIDFDVPASAAHDVATPTDVTDHVSRSPAYRELTELRNEAYRHRSSGSHAIARAALAALLERRITHAEHAELFSARGEGFQTTVVSLPDEAPAGGGRELDWAERAAGERPEDH